MAIISCPHCGTPNRGGSKFCNECGVTLHDHVEADDLAAPSFVPPAPPLGPDEETETEIETETETETGTEPDSQNKPTPPAARPAIRRFGRGRSRAAEPEPEDTFPPVPEPDPDQPWLNPKMDDADAATPPAPNDRAEERRLFSGLQGLLDPAEMADSMLPLAVPQPPVGIPTGNGLDSQTRRQLRTLAGSGMALADAISAPSQPQAPVQRPGWIALLIGLALGLPVLLLATSPDLRPHLWPGVVAAHKTIENLEAGSPVLINWAYDPATAGEMDLLAQPVVEHLLSRRAQLVVVSQLPGGPATARGLIDQAAIDLRRSAGIYFPASGPQRALIDGGFLPGGASALPLLGQDVANTVNQAELPGSGDRLSAQTVSILATQGPALTLIFAAQAEDVQEWLEQVQPLDNIPVIAVVSAGADPILRPYLDSGQLLGLVSGFDGAFNYSQRLAHTPSADQITRLQVQAVAQDWGMWIILLLILAGNVRGLVARVAHAGGQPR